MGYLLLVVIGGVVYLANAAYEFVLRNEAAVIVVAAIGAVGWFISSWIARSRNPATTASDKTRRNGPICNDQALVQLQASQNNLASG